MNVREYIPLAPLTTMDVGGPARYYAEVFSESDLVEARAFALAHNLPVFVLGGGSNIVIGDAGFPGLVIHNRLTGVTIEARDGQTIVTAGGGESWDNLVRATVEQNLAGLETLSGIPGTVGAAPVQNIGAYGVSLEQTFASLKAFDLQSGEFREFKKDECQFAYRTSRFKSADRGRYVIASVSLALTPKGEPVLAYHDLTKYFEGRPAPTLAEVRQAVLEIRARKGMVIRPEYESYKSVGSFFKNPIISKDAFGEIKAIVDEETRQGAAGCNDPWFWFQPDGSVKVAAACLLERAGFPKGIREGNVGLSPKHSLAVLNHNGATGLEVAAFTRKIQNEVKSKFHVAIESEAELIGF